MGSVLQVCLNGARTRADSPFLPVSARELAAAARGAVAAGAEDIHLHPKTRDGADSMTPAVVAETLAAVRAAVPGVPVGVTTGAWAVPNPRTRAELIRAWTVLPDHASVNWHEDGAELVAAALLQRGVGIEAGIYSHSGAADHFLASSLSGQVLRVLAEVTDVDPSTAAASALLLLDELAASDRPLLLHGEDGGAWPVLRIAVTRGFHVRIGLEDVLYLPGGCHADNAALVRAARAVLATVPEEDGR
jgi:uncharacterized protein (DUF849 family)